VRAVRITGMAVAAALLLTACGSATITVVRTSPAASIVITSDSNAISALKPKIQPQLVAGQSLVDGDQHSGDRVCGFTLNKNGHSYQVDAYGSLPNTTCSQQAQQSLLALLP